MIVVPPISQTVRDGWGTLLWKSVGEASEEFAVVLDFGRRAELLPVFLDGANAVRANRDDLLDLVLCGGFEIGFGELLEKQIVAEPANGIAGAFLLAQDAVARAEVV